MPQTCTICRHKEREAIDNDLVAGVPLRRIAAQSGTSTGALQRHRCHIAKAVIAAAETFEQERGASLLDKICSLEAEAKRLGRKAEQDGDLRAALLALRELGRAFELQGRMLGAFQPDVAPAGITVNVLMWADAGEPHTRSSVINSSLPTSEPQVIRSD